MFSRIAPQHPKKAITNMTQPSTIMMMGIVSTLMASLKLEILPMLLIISEPRTINRIPHITNIILKIYKMYLTIFAKQFIVTFIEYKQLLFY
uniref:Uncharacterized protein n=1 Tax=Haematobia irritans TaxID=7368 RepID=A0A1L8E874_HAEIR